MFNSELNLGPHATDWGASSDAVKATYFVTYSGYPFDVTDPTTWTYDRKAQRVDIARSLSNLCRYNGHVEYYSVAEHSVRVANLLGDQGHSPQTQRLGLWHDATEAYVGDVPRPYKHLVSIDGRKFSDVENDMAIRLFSHFEITYSEKLWDAVKEADISVYKLERDQRPRCFPSSKFAQMPNVAQLNWTQVDNQLSKWK